MGLGGRGNGLVKIYRWQAPLPIANFKPVQSDNRTKHTRASSLESPFRQYKLTQSASPKTLAVEKQDYRSSVTCTIILPLARPVFSFSYPLAASPSSNVESITALTLPCFIHCPICAKSSALFFTRTKSNFLFPPPKNAGQHIFDRML